MSPNKRKDSGKSPATDEYRKNLDKILDRAQKGDKKVLPALREAMNEDPEMYRRIGDLSRQVEHSVINSISGDDLITQETIPRHLSDMRKELAGDTLLPWRACW